MFEESRSFAAHLGASTEPGGGASRRALRHRPDTALSAIAWSDLTARLDAARELRRELRLDVRHHIEAAGASFSDAAAKYFRSVEGPAQTINLAALGEDKGLVSSFSDTEGAVASAPVASGLKADSPAAREDARDEQ